MGALIVAVGATVSTVHEAVAGVLPLPAASTARTANVCAPSVTAAYVLGDEHPAKALLSSEHWKLTPSSVSEKSNDADAVFTSPEVLEAPIVGAGGATESWVYTAELVEHPDLLPATSVARPKKLVVEPAER